MILPLLSLAQIAGMAATPPQPSLIAFEPGEVRCRGEVEVPQRTAQPLPSAAYVPPGRPLPSYSIAFRIAPDGRPLGIGEPDRAEGAATFVPADDLAASLAVWRFAAGAERSGCVVRFAARAVPVASAPIDTIYRYVALPRTGGAAYAAATKRIHEASPGCFEPRPPAERLRAFPDFDAIPQAPGTMSFTMVGFDIDARGKPVRVRTLASDGNDALNRAGIEAIARSRFAPGARTGCSYPFYRRQPAPIAGPPAPEKASLVPAGATCDSMADWAKQPTLRFPEPFRRRAIEGWAMIGYDVAPWGATGNIRVLAAEPAAAFGVAARQIVSAATRAPSATGATGCVERVIFRMPASESATPSVDLPPPD